MGDYQEEWGIMGVGVLVTCEIGVSVTWEIRVSGHWGISDM